jgi:hypothetical protein
MARRRGRWSGFVVGVLILLALLWAGAWYAADTYAQRTIARLNGSEHNGQRVACAEPTLSGFPLSLDLRCTQGSYSGPGQRITAGLGGIAASAPLYHPGVVEATLDAPLVLNAPAHSVALTASWARGAAMASAGLGGLTSAGASFTSLTADNSSALPVLPLKSLAADAASASIAPAGGGAYTLLVNTRKLALVRSDGGALPPIDADASLTALNVGASLGTHPTRTLIDWLRSGGSIKIDRIRIAAGGAVLGADGTLNISNKGVLSGSVVLRFTNLDAFAALAEQIRPGSREHAQQAMAAITALSVPVQTDDGPARQTTVSVTDGLVWVGIVPIGALPALRL